MADADITSTLAQHIARTILKQPNRAIKESEPIISSGLIDSFNLVDLALYIEDQFGVRIDDSELNAQTFDTLGQLADLIQQRRK
jgi:acyl carrier protein